METVNSRDRDGSVSLREKEREVGMSVWMEREDAHFSLRHAEFQETLRKASKGTWQTAGSGRMTRVEEGGGR